MTVDELTHTLRALEEELHRTELRRDSSRLRALLHADFEEIGRSGRRYTRDDMLRELPSANTRVTLRASIWVATAAGWQMRFHQGTPIETR